MVHYSASLFHLAPDPREAIEAAASLGLDGVGLPLFTPVLALEQLSDSGVRELRHLLSSRRLALDAVELILAGQGLVGDEQLAVDRVEAALRAAARLGGQVLSVDLGPLPPPVLAAPAPLPAPLLGGLLIIPTPPVPPAQQRQAAGDAAAFIPLAQLLRGMAARADVYGVKIACRATLACFESLRQLLAATDAPLIGFEVDTLSLLQDDLESDRALSAAGEALYHLRLSDGQRGQGGRVRPQPAGQGQINWRQLYQSLEQAGWSGFALIDAPQPRHIAAALGFFKTLQWR